MRGINFESFAKFILEKNPSIYVWICLQYIHYIQVLKDLIIVEFTKSRLMPKEFLNLIHVVHWVYGEN